MTTRRVLVPAALLASLVVRASGAFAQAAEPASTPIAPESAPSVPSAPETAPPDPATTPTAEAVAEAPPAPDLAEAAPPPPMPPPPPPPSRYPPLVESTTGAEAERPEPDDGLLGSHQTHFTFQLGVRTSFVSDPGFDLFSEDDVFPQVALSAGRVLVAEGPVSLAALVGWDFGSAGSQVRGATSNLEQQRLWLGGEARYHVFRRLYGFVRMAPALHHVEATLSDPVARAERESAGWAFGVDGSLGAAFEAFGKAKGQTPSPRGWVTADAGYGWVESEELTFSASEDLSAPTRTASLQLGELALRGGFLRVGVAVTF